LSGLGALIEDKAMPRGVLNNPDVKPMVHSTTRFEDVKGVDEAKAELEEIVYYLKDPNKFTVLGGKLPKVDLPWNSNKEWSSSGGAVDRASRYGEDDVGQGHSR